MSSEPKVDYDALAAFALLASNAAKHVAAGDPDELVVPMVNCPVLPGEQDDDGVRAIPAIDVLRYLVENHERGHTTFACAECGTTTAQTYVVTTLDYADVRHTRTEVCRACDDELRRE